MPQARNKIKTLLSFCIACHNPETRHQMFVANLNSLQFESNFELAEFSYITQDYQTAMGYYDHYITSKGHYKSKEKMQLALERLLSMYTQIEKEPAVAADYVNEYVHYLNEYPELKNLVQQWVVELKKSDPSIAINAGLENYVDNVLSHPDLIAVAWQGDEEVGRHVLRSATGAVRLAVQVDRTEIGAGPDELAFVEVTLVDEAGTVVTTGDRRLTVEVEGPGVLQGLASGRPDPEAPYTGPTGTTYDGRALAVIRPTGPGTITVRVSAPDTEPQELGIAVR